MIFSWKLLTGFGLGFYERQYPGTMLLLVAGVQIGVVGRAGLDHLPNDFKQALAHTTQVTGMTFALGAFLSVVNPGPGRDPQAALSPEMDGVTRNFVALVADTKPVNLAGLETDWGCSGDALQSFRVFQAMTRQLRKEKVVIDWSQNDQHKTTVCACSLRAKDRPTVSTPIKWTEPGAAMSCPGHPHASSQT